VCHYRKKIVAMKIKFQLALLAIPVPIFADDSAMIYVGISFQWLLSMILLIALNYSLRNLGELRNRSLILWLVFGAILIVTFILGSKSVFSTEINGLLILIALLLSGPFFAPKVFKGKNKFDAFLNSLLFCALVLSAYYLYEFLKVCAAHQVEVRLIHYLYLVNAFEYKPVLYYPPAFDYYFTIAWTALTMIPGVVFVILARMLFKRSDYGLLAIAMLCVLIGLRGFSMTPAQTLADLLRPKPKIPVQSKYPVGSEEFDREYADRLRQRHTTRFTCCARCGAVAPRVLGLRWPEMR